VGGSQLVLRTDDATGTPTNAVLIDSAQTATFTGAIQAATGTTTRPSLNIPHGSAPTTPVNGDMWTTTAGLYVHINGATVGPLA